MHSDRVTRSAREGLERIPQAVRQSEPAVWLNPARATAAEALAPLSITLVDVHDAQARWLRFAPLLQTLFPELESNQGRIDSELVYVRGSEGLLDPGEGQLFVKADHALPITGSIKARGGVYEVLAHAEDVAIAGGLIDGTMSYARLAEPDAKRMFATRKIVVGSTGNLGFSVGVMARALGFQAEVHMSSDAKAWKKERLRNAGVTVVEHASDYSSAVAAARRAAAECTDSYFVDDEHSLRLFFGYAVGAFDVAEQLGNAGVKVDSSHPLVVYLPCGVGGAPGGLCFGLNALFGDDVQCVFVEPTQAPCLLVQLASGSEQSVSVYEVGLSNKTEADGLAVSAASLFVARTVRQLVDAVVTVGDDELFAWVYRMWNRHGLRLEPSAAAGFAALPRFLATTRAVGRNRRQALVANSTHIVWTTGGSMLPQTEFDAVLRRGRAAADDTGRPA